MPQTRFCDGRAQIRLLGLGDDPRAPRLFHEPSASLQTMIALAEMPVWGPPGQLSSTGFIPGIPPAVSPDAPIGLYDSGVGGLTVLQSIAAYLPSERFIYIADQAHVPYGGRDLTQIRSFAGSLARYLFDRGCKMAVMACNISSATALDGLEAELGGEHVLGVIRPGAEAAARVSQIGKVGVLATAGTVASEAYVRALKNLDPAIDVHQVACPRFVPLVEAQQTHTEDAFDAARSYLAPLVAAGVDTVVLGCTHYPFLLSTLEAVAPEHLRFIDPAQETALTLRSVLQANQRVRTSPHAPRHQLLTTGDALAFKDQLCRMLPDIQGDVAALPWRP